MTQLSWCRLAATLLAGFSGCAATGGERLITHRAFVRWPPAPEPTRVLYVGQIRGPAEQSRVAEAIAGSARPRELLRPYAVTVTPAGLLAVADPGHRRLHLFDLASGAYRAVDDHGGTRFESPVGLAADQGGRLYLADSVRRRVFVFDGEGRAHGSFGGFQRPTGVAVDRRRGVIFVADTLAGRIHARSVEGRYLYGFGRRGGGPGEFNYPTHLFYSPARDELLVCDTLNSRIQRFGPGGRYLGSFGRAGDASGHVAKPKGVATDSEGHVYVVDALFDAVQIFDVSGRFLLHLGGPGEGPGRLAMPTGIYVDERDWIYVANTLNRRIEVLRYLPVEGSSGRSAQGRGPAEPGESPKAPTTLPTRPRAGERR